MKTTRPRTDGFTLVEVLAGMLFMAIVIPVAIEGITLAHRVGVVAERRREAARLAQSLLNEAIATESWRDGDQDEELGDDWQGFSYNLTSAAWSETGMTEVTVEVTFKQFGRDYGVTLSTLTQTDASGAETGTAASTSSTNSASTSGGSSPATRNTIPRTQ